MKLWQKGTAALLLLSMILLQSVAFAADKASDLQRKIDRLAAFGIVSKLETAGETPVTRGEMADLVVKATNNISGTGRGIIYNDVPADHSYCGAIETANTMGIVGINDQALFNPDAQITVIDALVMIVNAMGYADIASFSGGYPTGYLSVATSESLLKGVTGQYVTRADAIRMLSNMMDAASIERVYVEESPEYVPNESVTYLEDTFKVTKCKAEVQQVDTTYRTVVATVVDGSYNGSTLTFNVGENVKIETVGGKVTLYVDDFNFTSAIYIEPRDGSAGVVTDNNADSGIIYDIIASTNKNRVSSPITLSQWKYVTFTNIDKDYKISDSIIATYNDAPLAGQAYDYVGAFCKAVLQDGYIVRMDIYPLQEGGIIYRADADELRFSQGESYENYMMGFSKAPDLQIFIDGQAGKKMQDLKSNMVFDYWYDGGSKFIIVASSRVAKGVITNVDSEYAVIGDVEYRISETFGWYSFSAKDLSFIPGSINDIYGMEVTAYIDDNQRVRYIVPEIGKDENPTFKGFVMRTYGAPESGETYIKILRTDGAGEVKYKVREKMRPSYDGRTGLNYTMIHENYATWQQQCDALNLLLEFTLDKNGEICKMERIEYFNKTTEHPANSFFNSDYHAIGSGSKLIYADEASIYAIMNIDDKFTVKQLGYANDLVWTKPGAPVEVFTDFNLEENPVADLIVLGKNSHTIADSQNQLDIIESIKWTGEDDIWTVKLLGGESYDVDKQFITDNGLKKNMLIKYGRMSLGEFKFHVNRGESRDLSADCEDWITDNSSFEPTNNSGFYRASSVVERTTDIIQFSVSTPTGGKLSPVYLYINDNTAGYYKMKIFEYLGKGEIQKARDSEAVGVNIAWYIRPVLKYPVMNIQKGDDVWFHLTEDWGAKVDYMIYKSNHKFFD